MNGRPSSVQRRRLTRAARQAQAREPKPSAVVIWKIELVLLAAAIGILIAQLVLDAPVIQTRVGAAAETPALMYGGIGG